MSGPWPYDTYTLERIAIALERLADVAERNEARDTA